MPAHQGAAAADREEWLVPDLNSDFASATLKIHLVGDALFGLLTNAN
jgi:hypothetical protein